MNRTISIRNFLKTIFNDYLLLVGILGLVIITSIVEPNFLSIMNFTNLLRQFGPLSLVSLGITFVLLAGYIDLSIGGMMALVSVVTITLVPIIGAWPALIVGMCLGTLAGILNALILVLVGARHSSDALFITYGMSIIFRGLAQIYTSGTAIHLDKSAELFASIGKGSIWIFSVSFIIFLVFLLVLYILQSKTYIGRAIYIVGGNPTAAKLSAIPVSRSIFTVYALSGLMTAAGSIVLFSRVTSASPTTGTNFEINALVAVVIGGTSLKGGRGSVLRTVLGVTLLTLMSNCLNLLGVSAFMQNVLSGLIIIIAIWLDNRKGTKGGKVDAH